MIIEVNIFLEVNEYVNLDNATYAAIAEPNNLFTVNTKKIVENVLPRYS
jgi:hypothetical protein